MQNQDNCDLRRVWSVKSLQQPSRGRTETGFVFDNGQYDWNTRVHCAAVLVCRQIICILRNIHRNAPVVQQAGQPEGLWQGARLAHTPHIPSATFYQIAVPFYNVLQNCGM